VTWASFENWSTTASSTAQIRTASWRYVWFKKILECDLFSWHLLFLNYYHIEYFKKHLVKILSLSSVKNVKNVKVHKSFCRLVFFFIVCSSIWFFNRFLLVFVFYF
jgi:hypothetical protein